MKKSQLLNKIYLTILVFFLLQGTVTHAEDPVDIWKIEENSKKKIESSEIIKKMKKKLSQEIQYMKCSLKIIIHYL